MALLLTFLQNNPGQFRKNVQEEVRSQIGEQVAGEINDKTVPQLVEQTCQINDRGCEISKNIQLNLNTYLTVAAIVGALVPIMLVVNRFIIPLMP